MLKKVRKIALISLATTACMSCASLPQSNGTRTQSGTSVPATPKTELVREEMSKQQVRDIFGQPDRVSSGSLGSKWQWKRNKCFVEAIYPANVLLSFSCEVEFTPEGKVKGWNTNTNAYVVK